MVPDYCHFVYSGRASYRCLRGEYILGVTEDTSHNHKKGEVDPRMEG